MYGKSDTGFPQRIVCLTSEHVEICYALGAGERVVGVPGTAHRPAEARDKPRVGGFTSFRVDRILGARARPVLAFSDLQADISAELIRAGLPVLLHQPALGGRDPRRPSRWWAACSGSTSPPAIWSRTCGTRSGRCGSSPASGRDRPRVYFEEWHDPLIAGIRWVSEIIEIAGGRDIFPELRDKPVGEGQQSVEPADEVIRRDPEIILASWCGKPVDIAAIAARPGWEG